jgi:hypothetical protein
MAEIARRWASLDTRFATIEFRALGMELCYLAKAALWADMGRRFERYRNVRISLRAPEEMLDSIWLEKGALSPDEEAQKMVKDAMHQAPAIREEWERFVSRLASLTEKKSL